MKPIWHSNLVLICEKCGTKLQTSSPSGKTENPSVALKNRMKKEWVERSLWGPNRVITTSCLDVCPEGKIAVAFLTDQQGRDFQVETFDPAEAPEKAMALALRNADSRRPT